MQTRAMLNLQADKRNNKLINRLVRKTLNTLYKQIMNRNWLASLQSPMNKGTGAQGNKGKNFPAFHTMIS